MFSSDSVPSLEYQHHFLSKLIKKMFFHLYVPFLLSTMAYGHVTEHPFDELREMMKLDKSRSNAEDFNALHDLEGIFQQNLMSDSRISRRNGIHRNPAFHKKMDFKPKYDPGWKFIGLGKRPRQSEMYGYENRYDSFVPNDSEYYDDVQFKNPLVAMSTLMNFEVLNAIRLGAEEAASKDIKKGGGKQSQHFSGNSAENNRFSGRSLYMGKQNVMYDPAWMLTTLGK